MGHSSNASLPKNTWLLSTPEGMVWLTPGEGPGPLSDNTYTNNAVPRREPPRRGNCLQSSKSILYSSQGGPVTSRSDDGQ